MAAVSMRALAAVVGLAFLAAVGSAAVLGIDFGSDFLKVALVKPGMPFHIVIDEHSKRKIPVIIAFDGDERYFGTGATTLRVRKPKTAYDYVHRLLGQDASSPWIDTFASDHYPHSFKEIEGRGGAVGIVHKGNRTFSPEELIAMNLEHVKRLAERDAEGDVRDCVITVPEFWTQRQRAALLDAATLAGLNVLSLIHENTAAAVQYGIDLDHNPNKTRHIVFYNMGSTSTKVSVVRYSARVQQQRKQNKTIGALDVLASAFDPSLGGQSFDSRLVNHMFVELQEQVRKALGAAEADELGDNVRVWSKLRASARKTKEVLSANKEAPIYLEGAYQEVDFRAHVTRTQFYELAGDLFDRVIAPLELALKRAKVDKANVESLVLVGGSTRIPKIQRMLKDFLGTEELGMNLNADEAPALGAAFRAANISTQFRVRHLGMQDVHPFPMAVQLKSSPADDDGDTATADAVDESPEPAKKALRASMFKAFNRMGKRKSFALNQTHDFQCALFYDRPEKHLPNGEPSPIADFNITGVKSVITDPENAKLFADQEPRVSVSFKLSDSGLVDLIKAEVSADETVEVPVVKKKSKKADTKTKSKKGKTDEANSSEASEQEQEDEDSAASEHSETSDEESSDTESSNDTPDETSTSEEGSESSSEESSEASEATEKEPEVEYTTEVRTRKFRLKVSRTTVGVTGLSEEQRKSSRALLNELNQADEFRKQVAKAKNDLESFTYATRSRLYEEAIESVSTEEQRDELSKLLDETSDWIYEQDDSTDVVYVDRLKQLRRLSDPIFERAEELQRRPEAINTTLTLINSTRVGLERIAAEKPWITEEDRQPLTKLVDDLETWLNERLAEQESKELWEEPAFKVTTLYRRMQSIASRMRELLMKRKPKPKKPPKAKVNETATADANATDATDATDGEKDEESSAVEEEEQVQEERQEQSDEEQGDSEQSDPQTEDDDRPAEKEEL